ncbi:MAG: hypothetical protein RLZZ488_271 [Pseudomonadota bacterium]|jgi:dephospho-CoA kinase
MTGRQHGRLKKIAVTGGIGSGKSSLVRELALLGYPVFDADVLVAQVVLEPEVRQQITSLLGDQCYATDENGQVVYQRRWVRDRVFADEPARRSLENIIHPALFHKFESVCEQLNLLAGGIWVFYEAALIFEAGREKQFDAVVSVIATEEVRRARLAHSRSLPQETVSAIFSAQVSDQVRRAKSHFIIENSDDSRPLGQSALQLVQNLRNFFHPQSH